jgi:hypothetical protein
MNTNMGKIGIAFLAIGLCVWSNQAFAQATTTTVTTSKGAFTEYVPGSETVVVRGETNAAPLRYVVTKQTTVVDEAGAPVALERIPAGSPLSIQYTGTGDRLVASRIIIQKPVVATTTAPVTTQETTTTTTTSRPLTHHEKHEIKEAEEHRQHELKEQREHEKKAIEKAEDEDR